MGDCAVMFDWHGPSATEVDDCLWIYLYTCWYTCTFLFNTVILFFACGIILNNEKKSSKCTVSVKTSFTPKIHLPVLFLFKSPLTLYGPPLPPPTPVASEHGKSTVVTLIPNPRISVCSTKPLIEHLETRIKQALEGLQLFPLQMSYFTYATVHVLPSHLQCRQRAHHWRRLSQWGRNQITNRVLELCLVNAPHAHPNKRW